MKYKSKLRERLFVDAIQLTKSNFDEVGSFLGTVQYGFHYANERDFLKKQNPTAIFINQMSQGPTLALISDYIIKYEGGMFDICGEERFLNSFEAIVEPVKAVGD